MLQRLPELFLLSGEATGVEGGGGAGNEGPTVFGATRVLL